MAYAIKANGAGESLLTTAFNKNYWPTASLVPGIFDGNTGVQCIGRSGIGFIRANAIVAADWPSETKKKIMTLPEPSFIAVLHDLKSRIKTGLTAFRKGGLQACR